MKTGCFKNCLAAASFALTALAATGGEDLARWVDPFVGTGATGHTFPAACVPFGLVQAGPDTGNGSWDYCSGYRHGDKTICGFTQTHLNGTGCPDLGDVLILPMAESREVGENSSSSRKEGDKVGVSSSSSRNDVKFHSPTQNSNSNLKLSEIAEPGYYAVTLDGGIKVEIAAADHSAIYRITGNGRLRLLVDCAYGIGGKDFAKTITASDAKLIGKSGLSGKNHRRQWVERDYSFVVKFGREFAAVEELPKREGVVAPQYVFDFDLDAVAQERNPSGCLLVKVALSAEGGVEAAERNLAAEIADWDFDAVKNAARAKWNEVLSRAKIEGTGDQKKNWYTSLYHLFVQPNNIADAGAKPFYSTFSTWDTFRAAHPLYTILTPEKAAEFVDSMLEQGRRTGYLPIWTLWGKDNQCMIGTHSVPVIVDWFLKEVGGNSWSWRKDAGESWSPELEFEKGRTNSTLQLHSPTPLSNSNFNSNSYWLAAYAQIKDTLTKPHKGRIKERWDLLDKYGYYPFDEIKGESVSRTLECAYDDWCAGVMAAKLSELGTGNGECDKSLKADAAFFFRRSESWRNVFDASIGLVRGKDSNGKWREPYDPYTLGHGADKANDFTEGNAFQYTWHIMQNPQGLVDAMGGRDAFVEKLDSLFEAPSRTEGMGEVLDVTGLIGQYVHGNEPSHHVIYFYPQVGHPEKAAERIREVFDKFYLPKPDGLCGNDDCGQMSAWYVFSAMGFYPFNPCGGEYILGAPQVERVEIELERIVGVGERMQKKVGDNSWSSRNEEQIPLSNSTLQLHSPTPLSNSNFNSNSYWLAAYAQIKDTLTKPHKGRIKERWDLLDKYGYYPFDEIKGESVSRTLECAYDDWCAGVMAAKLSELGTGNGECDKSLKADAAFFFRRSESWRNVFDASIGLVRGKDSNGKWREPYDPYTLGHGADKANDFTEGNAFQYTWHIMQNPQGLVDAIGGRDAFVKKLDSLFEAPSKTEGMGEVLDVTGLIGQYVQGNEPSHHVIYFYPQVGYPEKAAERIREVFDKFYLPKPDGLCGNDDCGQMSAWYIFSAMGFYPFNPCGGEYILGAPQIACAKLRVESGEFRVIARHLSKENKYVKSVTLNGKPITDWKIRHSDIMSGGELVFEMCSGDKAKHACPLRQARETVSHGKN